MMDKWREKTFAVVSAEAAPYNKFPKFDKKH